MPNENHDALRIQLARDLTKAREVNAELADALRDCALGCMIIAQKFQEQGILADTYQNAASKAHEILRKHNLIEAKGKS